MSAECAICLTSLAREIAALQCGHVFHGPCIRLLRTQVGRRGMAKCPLCRVSIRGVLPLFMEFQRARGGANSLLEKGDCASEETDSGTMLVDESPLENAALLVANVDHVDGGLVTAAPNEELQRLRRQYEEALIEIQQLESARNEAAGEIEELELELGNLSDYLDRLTHERVDISQSLQRSETELQIMKRERDGLRMQLGATQEELSGSQHEILELRAELEGMRAIRLAKETERLLGEMSELETSEYLASLRGQPRIELEMHFSLLTLRCRNQERDIDKLREELRVSRVELETVQRQMRRMKATSMTGVISGPSTSIMMSHGLATKDRSPLLDTQAIPTKRSQLVTIADRDESSEEGSYGKVAIIPVTIKSLARPPSIPSAPFLPLPPKFTTTRWQSTVPDGSGGQRRSLAFPPRPL